jgi:hypothetical protein
MKSKPLVAIAAGVALSMEVPPRNPHVGEPAVSNQQIYVVQTAPVVAAVTTFPSDGSGRGFVRMM